MTPYAKSMNPVFQISELLLLIFSFLEDDGRSLNAVVRVNKRFFELGIEFLWLRPRISSFLTVPPHRRQLYASRMQRVGLSRMLLERIYNELDHSPHYTPSLNDLVFPNLKHVVIIITTRSTFVGRGPVPYLPVFQPSLEELMVISAVVDDRFLEVLTTRCPRLRKLTFRNPGGEFSPDAFSRFLEGCSNLEDFTIQNVPESSADREILLRLATLGNLRVLAIHDVVEADTLRYVSAGVPVPFTALEKIRMNISFDAVPMLADLIHSVTDLNLSLRNRRSHVQGGAIESNFHIYIPCMRHLHSLTHLRSVKVDLNTDAIHIPSEIASIRHLSSLQSLEIYYSGYRKPSEVTYPDFDALVARLPSLRNLAFHVSCDLSGRALESLARHCPQLETCNIKYVYERQNARIFDREKTQESPINRAVLFPNLNRLSLHGFLGAIVSSPSE